MSELEKLPTHVSRNTMAIVLDDRLSAISPHASDSPAAFIQRALHWASDWLHRHSADGISDVRPFAIVRGEVGEASGDLEWKEEILFREDPSRDLSGVIAVTGSISMAAVHTATLPITRLRDLGAALVRAGLGDKPTLLFEPARGRMYPCPAGCSGERDFPLNFDGTPLSEVTEGTVSAALDEFHLHCTQYPDGSSHVWHDRPSRTLRSDAEAIVRDDLYKLLWWRTFRSQLVIREQQTSVGRADLSILDKIGGKLRTVCVMELKVLRSRGMHRVLAKGVRTYGEPTMTRHARMGLTQVMKYKRSESAALGFLCLYDGRDSNKELVSIPGLAASNSIQYRRYFMETSTRDDLHDLQEGSNPS